MVFTPNISNNPATPCPQNDPALLSGQQTRRGSESVAATSAASAIELAISQLPESQANGADSTESIGPDYSLDIGDANAADSIMTSLRATILTQPGAGLLAQANFSPESVLKLLE
jgi:flagellin-like hook-associated protein FlgL